MDVRAGLPERLLKNSVPGGRRLPWGETLRAGGVIALVACLPLIVVTRWYDYYYWPKIFVLYGAVGALSVAALQMEGDRWLRGLGSPAGAALAGWLGILTVSTLMSVNPLLSLVGEDYRYEGLLTWLAYGAVVALVAGTLFSARRIRVFLAVLLTAATVMAVLGLLQRWGFTPVPEDALRVDLMKGMPRAWGTTGNPLALGAYLVLLLPVTVSLYAREARLGRRCLLAAATALMYAALVATVARAAWGALLFGLAVWAAATGLSRLRAAAGPLILLGILLAAITPPVLYGGPVGHAGPAAGHVPDPGGAVQRMFLWRTVAPQGLQRPVLGWGPETLAGIYPGYEDPQFKDVFPEARTQRLVVDRPHNDLLQQAVATGLLGLAVYAWFWFTLFRTGWWFARGDHERAALRPAAAPGVPPGLAAGLLGGFAAYFAQLQFSFSYVSVAPVFWALVGTLLALVRRPAR